jgi:hypothetical protein
VEEEHVPRPHTVAAAAGEDGEVALVAELKGGDGVFGVGGDDDAQGLDLKERGVGGVEHAIVEPEADLAGDGGGELAGEAIALRGGKMIDGGDRGGGRGGADDGE